MSELTNNSGWIKLHRKFTDWEWYNHLPTKVLFLHLLLTANHQDAKWRGTTIARGQKITSYGKLASELALTIQQIRTAISNLKSTGEITQQGTSQYSLISITNYEKYQGINTPDNNQSTINQQSINNQSTTNKNEKKNKNKKNDKEDKKDIAIILPEFLDLELWQSFLDMRKQKGKVPTEKAKIQLLKKLQHFQDRGLDPNLSLSNSIENDWIGLFEPKINNNKQRIIYGKPTFGDMLSELAGTRQANKTTFSEEGFIEGEYTSSEASERNSQQVLFDAKA